jgi:hypothetical protein
MRRYPTLALSLWLATACVRPGPDQLAATHRRALADSVTSLFDSLAAIHRDRPDTGLLRRLHPPADTVLFIEGSVPERSPVTRSSGGCWRITFPCGA